MRLAACFLAVALAVCAQAQSPQAESSAHDKWRPVDAETGQIRDIAELERLARDFPDSGSVRMRLLQAYLDASRPDDLLDTLRWLHERGYVFSSVSREQIPKLVGDNYADRASALLLPAAEPIVASEIIAAIPADALLIESVARDPQTRRLIATAVVGRAAWMEQEDGSFRPCLANMATNLSGIAVSQTSGQVWVSSSQLDDATDAVEGFVGLLGLHLGSARRPTIVAPDGVNPSDLTTGPDGTLFTSDPLAGGVYFALPTAEELQTLIPAGTFRSPQGLSVSANGTRLYVSDYRYGIAIVDLESRVVSRLRTDLPLILDGVDGMWLYGNELVVIQNGTSPMRIAAFELSGDGTQIIGHRNLERANPEWTEPLGGSLDGDSLIYVGNGQWDRFVNGKALANKPPLPTQIRQLSLRLK